MISQNPKLNEIKVCDLCFEKYDMEKSEHQNKAAHLCKHVSTQLNLKIKMEDFIPKFVTLEEAFEGLKDKELIFNRCWSFLFPILTETNIDDLMDVEKLALNAVISVKHSSRFSF